MVGTAVYSCRLEKNCGSLRAMHKHHHAQEGNEERHRLSRLLRPGLHKDWRTWVVIGLMLAAIGIYVLTLDEAVQPGPAPQTGVPAAGAPR
jgi:hypothetical protein